MPNTYAYQVAKAMGLNAVEYNLRKYDGRLCSVCELFTSKDVSFVPISRLVSKGGINAVTDYYKNWATSILIN